jgi:putative ABC transport system ATP-binding protein
MSDVLIEVRDVQRSFDEGRVQALRGVDFKIHDGEFLAIVGPSGSGKSSLLQILGALDEPSEGEVFFHGKSVAEIHDISKFRAENIGFVFQSFHLIPTLTAIENVQIPMFEMPWSPAERARRATELLKSVGLSERMHHLPRKMSGGERQRVAVARSLANEPKLLLADEPTGNLDSINANEIIELLLRINKFGTTVILVTHNREIVNRLKRRVITLENGMVISDQAIGKYLL